MSDGSMMLDATTTGFKSTEITFFCGSCLLPCNLEIRLETGSFSR